MENSGIQSTYFKAPLSMLQLIEVGKLLEESVSLATRQVLITYNICPEFTKAYLSTSNSVFGGFILLMSISY